jgi:exodeoxyribonuclease VII large subunit
VTLFPPDDLTLTVSQLHAAINRALKREFADSVWIRGEVQRVKTHPNGNTYFEIVEKRARGGVEAMIDVALLKWNRAGVDAAMRRTSNLVLESGIEVRIRGRATVYAGNGRLQFEMTGIDPEFTLGRLAADRDRLLTALRNEGLLEVNAACVLALVPMRVGVITSVDSAAYHDFMKELGRSRFGWRVETFDVRVQGREAPRLIARALRHADERDLDVIVLIRGGGSRTELMAFDTEVIARAITALTTPLFTGIGHETDRSIADEVAHRAFKTPTAVAQELVGRVRDFSRRVEAYATRVQELAPRQLDEASAALTSTGRHLRAGVRHHLALADRHLDRSTATITRTAPMVAIRATVRVDTRAEQIARAVPALLQRRVHTLDAMAAQVRALDPVRVLARGYSITRAAGEMTSTVDETTVATDTVPVP